MERLCQMVPDEALGAGLLELQERLADTGFGTTDIHQKLGAV